MTSDEDQKQEGMKHLSITDKIYTNTEKLIRLGVILAKWRSKQIQTSIIPQKHWGKKTPETVRTNFVRSPESS